MERTAGDLTQGLELAEGAGQAGECLAGDVAPDVGAAMAM
jgi:hypothetical protein